MITYKIFIDKYGELEKDEDLEKVKKLFDYTVQQKKDGVGKFVDNKIYLIKENDGSENIIAQDTNDETFLLGGNVVIDSLNITLLNRYINSVPFDPIVMDKMEGYYENNDLFLNDGGTFIKSISKNGNIFVIYEDAVKEEYKLHSIINCMAKQNVLYKLSKT